MSWNIQKPGDYLNGPLTVMGNVGIGTTTFTSIAGYTSLKINNATNGAILDLAQGDAYKGRVIGSLNGLVLESAAGLPVQIQVGGLNSFKLDPAGVYTWYDGAGGTNQRMQLNSTGLGIGGTPLDKFTVVGNSFLRGAAAGIRIGDGGGYGFISAYDQTLSTPKDIVLQTGGGNVGIGLTPSAWGSDAKAIQMAGSVFSAVAASARLLNLTNCYWDGTNFRFTGNGTAQQFRISAGTSQFEWHLGASGTTGNIVSFTQAMTLDASGYLLIGTTDTAFTSGAGYKFGPGATPSSGQVGASSSNGDLTYRLYSTGAAAYRFYVGFGGTVFATNTTISAISDQRLKENVQDIDVGLGAILALKPRKFDWKAGKGKDIKGDRGFIAQEFEQVFPQLVDEWADPAPEGETPYKSVRQDLIPVLVKAIQELAAEVNALKNA